MVTVALAMGLPVVSVTWPLSSPLLKLILLKDRFCCWVWGAVVGVSLFLLFDRAMPTPVSPANPANHGRMLALVSVSPIHQGVALGLPPRTCPSILPDAS